MNVSQTFIRKIQIEKKTENNFYIFNLYIPLYRTIGMAIRINAASVPNGSFLLAKFSRHSGWFSVECWCSHTHTHEHKLRMEPNTEASTTTLNKPTLIR